MARLLAFAAIAAMTWTGLAAAGDVYVCKDAKGHKTFQDVPCATAAQQEQHETYREPDPPAPGNHLYAPQLPRPTVATAPDHQPAEPSYGSPVDQVAPAPVAYTCTAGRRRWVQTTPCPSSYTTAAPVFVQGMTQTGQPINGFGTTTQQAPVDQQVLDRDALCKQVRDGASMGRGLSAGRQSYERNKLRDQYNCGA